MPKRAGRLLLPLLLIMGNNAAADEAATVEALTQLPMEDLVNMQVYSASKFAQKVSDAPAAATVVTADEIRAYGWRTLADVLSSIRGLYIRSDRDYSYLGTRGFGRPGDYNTRILLLIDGYRANDAVYDQAYLGTEGLIDVELIDRVEFVPGPGSAIYGGNAFFGVVNVITKSGKNFDGSELAGEVASYDTHKGRATFGKKFSNGLDVLFSASGYESAGRTHLFFPEFNTPQTNNGVAENLDHDRYQRYFAKISFENFTLEAAHSERNKAVPTAAFGQVFNAPGSFTFDQQTFLNLRYYQNLTEQLELSGSAHYGRYGYDADYIMDNPPVTVNTDVTASQWSGGEIKLTSTQIDRHRLVWGAEYQNDFQRDQKNFDQQPRFSYLNTKNPAYRAGTYVQDEFALLDNLSINAGLRFDYNSTITSSQTEKNLAYKSINPRLALIYKPAEATTLKLLYGTAFRRPNAYELFYGAPTGAGGFVLNPKISPERVKTYEAILEHYFENNLRATLNGFFYQISDLITSTVDQNGALVFRNLGQAQAHGAEFAIEKLWDDGMRLRTSYSWQEAQDADTGARLANSPRHLAKLNFSAPLVHDTLRAGLELQYVGARKTLQGMTLGGRVRNGADANDYLLTNLTLTSDKLLPGLDISASIYNLFDTRYQDPASDEHEMDVIRQNGRQLRLKLTFRF